MKLSEIRESYPAAKEAIEELIRIERKQDRELLILRGPKDQGIRHVFWNPIRGDEATPVAAGEWEIGRDESRAKVGLGHCIVTYKETLFDLFIGLFFLFFSSFRAATLPGSPEFRDLWHSLQTPNEVDLQHEMEKGTSPLDRASGSRVTLALVSPFCVLFV